MFQGDGTTEALMITTVTITPTAVNGTDVDCEISGADVVDGAIFLNKDDTYDLTFQLQGGGGVGVAEFDHSNPFANRNAQCPGANAKPQPPCAVTVNPGAPQYDSFTVRVSPTGNKGVTHYRMNFADGLSCDPIMIHV